ncbi:metal-dependent hydrolase [Acidicapsa ligni]|uniref:metal-dependent hydrolase n=1 Tax=Acidicapsa ligni TaxID=542300 RepID=UPI0021DFA62E|nr:metal-dependent hydrolase [Acidicapsa ligni]
MEPVTHILTGACIGRAGLNRRTAYATLAAVLAADAPDLDVVWNFAGQVAFFQHHRGITHTFLAAPFIALAVTGAVWLFDRVWTSRRSSMSRVMEPQPIRWLWVWLSAFIADLSHLLLDWTNNYGIRPFFPFNDRWYSGDLVFIAEPILWGLLLIALILPALLGLADREVGARRTQFRGRSLAIVALTGMVVLWCWRWAEQAHARNLVQSSQITPTPVTRIALEPYPVNPFRWHALLETATTWQTAEVDTRTGSVESDPTTDTLFKPPITPAVQIARRTRLGQVYMDWAQWPVVRDLGPQPAPGIPAPTIPPAIAGATSSSHASPWTNVQFADLRFAYNYLDTLMTNGSSQQLNQRLDHPVVGGYVYIFNGEEVGQYMNGRE